MQAIDELLAEAPAFEGMAPAHLELIAGCARNEVFEEGAYLMREGDPADHFYAFAADGWRWRPSSPSAAAGRETIDDGDLLGWSWLVPPYRAHLDARALTETHAIAFDAACLRGKCEQDPALGYELMKRFVPVIVERLQATRFRLLDVYGHVETG